MEAYFLIIVFASLNSFVNSATHIPPAFSSNMNYKDLRDLGECRENDVAYFSLGLVTTQPIEDAVSKLSKQGATADQVHKAIENPAYVRNTVFVMLCNVQCVFVL